jgi:L-fuculose-phosphate aldolase
MDDVAVSPQFLVAAARRILSNEGCASSVQGHVSVRAEDKETFWVTPWQYQDETMPQDVSRVTMDLRTLEGLYKSSPAIQFHAAIYQARPDINAIVHTHSHWVQVLSTTGRLVGLYAGESTIVHGLQVFLDDEQAFLDDDARLLAASLGSDMQIIILKNHGSITTGATIEEATVRAIMLEYCARLQIEAELIGGTPYEATDAYIKGFRRYVTPEIWAANVRRLRKTDPDLFAAERSMTESECGDVHRR